MDALHGEGEIGEAMGAMTALISSTPEMRETTKFMLLEALGQAGEMLDIAKSLSPELKDLFEVLITDEMPRWSPNWRARSRSLPLTNRWPCLWCRAYGRDRQAPDRPVELQAGYSAMGYHIHR